MDFRKYIFLAISILFIADCGQIKPAYRGIWLGIYPEVLCRELTLASLGKPTDPAIVEFLK